jgi:hypothetical protein
MRRLARQKLSRPNETRRSWRLKRRENWLRRLLAGIGAFVCGWALLRLAAGLPSTEGYSTMWAGLRGAGTVGVFQGAYYVLSAFWVPERTASPGLAGQAEPETEAEQR